VRNPWEWKKGNNPYRWNAFTLIKATPDDTGPGAINQKLERMKRLIKRMPDRAEIDDRPLKETDLSRASEILSSPNERMLEELLCHRPHYLEPSRFKEHEAYFRRLPIPKVQKGILPRITNWGALCAFLPELKPRELSLYPFPGVAGDEDLLREEIVFRT